MDGWMRPTRQAKRGGGAAKQTTGDERILCKGNKMTSEPTAIMAVVEAPEPSTSSPARLSPPEPASRVPPCDRGPMRGSVRQQGPCVLFCMSVLFCSVLSVCPSVCHVSHHSRPSIRPSVRLSVRSVWAVCLYSARVRTKYVGTP